MFGDNPNPFPRGVGPVDDRNRVHVVQVERLEAGCDLPNPLVERPQGIRVRRFPVAAVGQNVGLATNSEMLDAAVGEGIYFVDHRFRRTERGVAIEGFRTERTSIGTAPGGLEFTDEIVGVVRVLFDNKRSFASPSGNL